MATQSRSKALREFVAKPSWNPLEVLGDARALATAGGGLVAYLKRKWAYKRYRAVFGVAQRHPETGAIIYYAINEDGTTDTTKQVAGAHMNRIAFNAIGVVAASVIILQAREPILDYFALGVIASDGANIVLLAANLE